MSRWEVRDVLEAKTKTCALILGEVGVVCSMENEACWRFGWKLRCASGVYRARVSAWSVGEGGREEALVICVIVSTQICA